ncbi:LMBR1 domain-containing protein 2 homolog [Phlebotomus argentipes]|uniref:LMBR1 domain-containing protein 2 homolog n=1 Tax=Phlebotomus argentipes TaxID=94469 RepID=UPI002892FDE1|nr:LMBR1 domain-containing protein 2 homolog [Phlebotomus argentipes]
MAWLLEFSLISSFLIACVSLYRYGKVQLQNVLVTITVAIAWCFSFSIVFIIPQDITATVYRQCQQENNASAIASNLTSQDFGHNTCQQPWGMVSDSVFLVLWRIIYWSSQFLTWLIMPLMQSYLKSGEFTIKGKLTSALVDNAIYYGTYLFICGILLIYLIAKPEISLDWQKLKAIASSASNTWGLFLLILLLGYALVEVPRSLWNDSNPQFMLLHAYFKLSKLNSEKIEAEENVEDVLDSLHYINNTIPHNHELRVYVNIINRKVPVELMERYKRKDVEQNISSVLPSEKSLSRLHRQVIKSLQVFQRTQALWNIQIEKVLHYEAILKNLHSSERCFRSEFGNSHSRFQNAKAAWYWYCLLRPPLMKALAVATAFLSVTVVWSELTFFNRSPVLSIFANVVNLAKRNYDFLTIELFSMFVLCYLCYCAYSTVFRIKFLNLYYLAPHHQTNEHSLIFCGMLLCRLTPPICLNFLGLIHMDSHIIKERISETFYTQVMGHMDVLEIISDGFNIYFPMLMIAFCLATWFNLGSRTLNALGFQQFMVNEDMSDEIVQEGKDLISREKRKKRRMTETASRRRNGSELRSGNYLSETESTQIANDNFRVVENTDFDDIRSNITQNFALDVDDSLNFDTDDRIEFRAYTNDDSGHYKTPTRLFDDV